ncbi:class I SAM-dependent methyltransferase [Paraburkholderia aspalathi]|uniref:Methyltransferase domain-containing protein n=1 Tax=Paraburkholderia aspalathi TaxID=1324617 RepID=A0A1I7EPQ5_9BURK|nr:class I SAM-dependent methyltransferase [Paraburkholderia aspalathi]SFU25885.1 Methyltransferase domain-containing protein [Paraburkholderia aspalathi]
MVAESSFFSDSGDDDLLESRNEIFWEALLDNIRRDGFPKVPNRVLDIGCHRGGLLARIAKIWGACELYGIEPIQAARARAQLRLSSTAPVVRLLSPDQWDLIPNYSIDLVVCHEVMFLLPDLGELAKNVARVLARNGRAYIAWGCHSENPVWPKWREALELQGVTTYTHEPIGLMGAAALHGLLPSVRPLRESGWATFDPTSGPFTFPTIGALLDHQFRHKLLFRLVRT